MVLFFLVVAAFFIPVQGLQADGSSGNGNYSEAGDLGPYGNYSGSCALRPVNGDQTKNVMCFPNEARALEFGDILWIYRVNVNENATGSDIYWSVNLLSSDFKALFHLSVRPRAEKYGFVALNNNNGQWLNGKWGVEESHAIEFNLGEASEIRIENTPEALKIRARTSAPRPGEKETEKSFTFAHRTANPATDYKYLYLHKPTQSFGVVEYYTQRNQGYSEVIERSEQSFAA